MQRRDFLRRTIGIIGIGVVNTLLAGCGGANVTNTSGALQVQVDINGKSKTVTLNSGQTVLDAIKKTFSYKRLSDSTIIDGITANWRYAINGIEPDIYAGDYNLDTNCAIALRSI